MDNIGLVMIAAAALGLLAILVILRRERHDVEALAADSPFAASTEGQKICAKCGMGNPSTERNCVSCRARLPG